jgi:choline dehydrogenase-like flavoprotein
MAELMPDWGARVALGDGLMPIVQARVVGGGTVINSAIMVRTPGDVLRDWRDRLGLGQVFDEAAVGAAQDAIEAELAVGPTPVGPRFGGNNALLLDALGRRGLEAHPTARNVAGCVGSAGCLQGCKTAAKRSTNLQWLPEVIARGGVVVSCAQAERIELRAGRAVGVRARWIDPDTRRRGARLRVQPRRGVIVAASPTATPALLARSGVRLPALGRGFRAHPGAALVGVYDAPVGLWSGATQGTASTHLRGGVGGDLGPDAGAVGVKLESLALPLELLAGRTAGAGVALMQRLRGVDRQAVWIAAVRAEAEGTCRPGPFGGTVVRYNPTARDREALRRGLRLLAELHVEAGARAVRPGIAGWPDELAPDQLGLMADAPLTNRQITWVLSHLFGGAAMGADPRASVVGPDLAVRGVANLHVACGAALPTTLGVNPQHTIMAVARILADRLANQAPPGSAGGAAA